MPGPGVAKGMESRMNTQWVQVRRTALIVGALVVVAAIIWLDIVSGIWQEVVILSGLAAGLVTFVLTVLVLDRVLARSTARRWAPVNRLALSEFLHALADDDVSEISRGQIVPRALPHVERSLTAVDYADALHRLRSSVVHERRRLSDALSRWAPFLASSGDNETILQHIAEIALLLDSIRDATIDAEDQSDADAHAHLTQETRLANEQLNSLVTELNSQLHETRRQRGSRVDSRVTA